jgi:NADP-reducing hydrogenase subunit HndB
MEKIQTLQDLLNIRAKVQRKTSLREDGYRACITVHMGTCGIASGAREVINAVADALAESGRTDVRLTNSGCIGACEYEPVMTVETLGSDPVLYGYLDAEKAKDIFRRHILEGQIVGEHLVYVGKEPSDFNK